MMIRLIPATMAILGAVSSVQAQIYVNLIQDARLSHWMNADGSNVGDGWKLLPGGVLHLSGRGGNIVTREQYGDFDLWFDYRISEKGNNGIKYRVQQYGNSMLGLEYQIQDDHAFPRMLEKHRTASIYDLIAISHPVLARNYRPLSEYNTGRIVVQNNRIRHWMNGNLIIDEQSDSSKFDQAVSDSKFRDREGFGRNRVGRLMLTDHNSEVWFRNVYVRRLDGCSTF